MRVKKLLSRFFKLTGTLYLDNADSIIKKELTGEKELEAENAFESKGEYFQYLSDIWENCLGLITNADDGRAQNTTTNLTMNIIFILIFGVFVFSSNHVSNWITLPPLFLMISLSWGWRGSIIANRRFNNLLFKVLLKIEDKMPVRPFTAHRSGLRQQIEQGGYTNPLVYESFMAVAFISLYTYFSLYLIVTSVVHAWF